MKNPETAKPVRGKYLNLLREGSNIAILDADLIEHFPNSESVNEALRAFLAIGQQVQSVSIRKAPRSTHSKSVAGFDPLKSAARKTAAKIR